MANVRKLIFSWFIIEAFTIDETDTGSGDGSGDYCDEVDYTLCNLRDVVHLSCSDDYLEVRLVGNDDCTQLYQNAFFYVQTKKHTFSDVGKCAIGLADVFLTGHVVFVDNHCCIRGYGYYQTVFYAVVSTGRGNLRVIDFVLLECQIPMSVVLGASITVDNTADQPVVSNMALRSPISMKLAHQGNPGT